MRNFSKGFKLTAVFLGLFVSVAIAATYTQTLLADGTNLWSLVSSNSSAVSQMSLLNGTTSVLTVDPVVGIMPLQVATATTVPTCNTARKGALVVVTDASSPTYGGTYTGSSTTVALMLCNGSAWLTH